MASYMTLTFLCWVSVLGYILRFEFAAQHKSKISRITKQKVLQDNKAFTLSELKILLLFI